MNRLQTRLKKLEMQFGITDKNDLSSLSDDELEARIRNFCIKHRIDPPPYHLKKFPV